MPYSPRTSGGGSSFDPANPGNIGTGTPGTGTFTTLSASGVVTCNGGGTSLAHKFYSGALGNYVYTAWGRTADEIEFGVAGADGQFFTDALQGDAVLKAPLGRLLAGWGNGHSSLSFNTDGSVSIGALSVKAASGSFSSVIVESPAGNKWAFTSEAGDFNIGEYGVSGRLYCYNGGGIGIQGSGGLVKLDALAANVFAQSNGAAAQTFILSALEVDNSNYSRLVISTVGGQASLTIDEAGSGTGTLAGGIVFDGSNITLPIGSSPTSIGSLFDSGGSALHALVADSAGTATIAASVSGSVPDGTYTMGIGGSTNGTITITTGVITSITEAS